MPLSDHPYIATTQDEILAEIEREGLSNRPVGFRKAGVYAAAWARSAKALVAAGKVAWHVYTGFLVRPENAALTYIELCAITRRDYKTESNNAAQKA